MTKSFVVVLFFSLSLFASCATMADYDFSFIDEAVKKGDYYSALDELEKDASVIYSKHDDVLALLDRGILLHFAKAYEQSNKALSEAEKLIAAYQAKSISQAIGSALLNDTVIDYAGEAFEDIYTNIFMCLNYIALGLFDDAMVEIRRFDNKMKNIGSRYQAERALLQKQFEQEQMKQTTGSGATVGRIREAGSSAIWEEDETEEMPTEKPEVKFHNSALARYLSLLLYRADNSPDDARIDLKNIEAAFRLQPTIYDFAMPPRLSQEAGADKETARINCIAFHGASPIKMEETFRIALGGFYYKIGLPKMEKRASDVSSVSLTAVSSDGKTYRTTLSKIESVENIALDTFNDHYNAIALKTSLRAFAKAAASISVQAVGSMDNRSGANLAMLFGFFMNLTTEFTERADIRSSRYFPANASVGCIDVPPGVYDVSVEFYNSRNKRIYASKTFGFEARGGATGGIGAGNGSLNLIEAACYK